MTETIDNVNEETIELSIDDLEAILGQGGTQENINIAEMLETEMVNKRVLYLNGEVTDESINYMIQLINLWNKDDYGLDVNSRIPIEIHIQSGGGDLYASLQLVSAVESSITPIHTFAYGMVASASYLLFVSGHVRYLSKFATLLYHELSANMDISTLRNMQNTVKHYEHLQNMLDEHIVDRTDIPMKKLKKKRKKNIDWYITLEEATKYNMYDELID